MAPPRYGRSAPLPYRSHRWRRNTIVALSTAVGVCAGGPLVNLDLWVTTPLAAAAVLAAGLSATRGQRRHERLVDEDRCAEQLCGVLGLKPTRAVMRTEEWVGTDHGVGYPARVVVYYTDAGTELDPDWRTRIDEVMSGQPWGRYALSEHNSRTCELVYERDFTPEPEPDPEGVARTKRVILKILGPTATIVGDPETQPAPEASEKQPAPDSAPEPATVQVRRIVARLGEDGVKFAPVGYRDRVEKTVSALLPGGRWRALWDLEQDRVTFEIRPAFDPIIWHEPTGNPYVVPYEKVFITYSNDEDGHELGWRPLIDPHMILIGATGTGKTAAVHTVVTAVARLGWMVWVVDGKGTEFLGFRDWPNIQIVASKIMHQAAVIHRVWQEMELRYEAIEAGADESQFTPLLLVVDEFADFKANLENWYQMVKVKGDPAQPRTLLEIASIVRKGRSARIHMVISTQRPDMDFFGGRGRGDTRDSLRMRVSLGPLSPQGAMMMWNSSTTGTLIPKGVRGRATAVTDDNRYVEVQCFYTPDPRRTVEGSPEYERLQRLRPGKALHERLVILEPDLEEDDEDETDIDEIDETPRPRSRRTGNGSRRRNNGHNGTRPKNGSSRPKRPPQSVFKKYVEATWGLASRHPDIDPVERRKKMAEARAAGEHYTLLGLNSFLEPTGPSNGATEPSTNGSGPYAHGRPVDTPHTNGSANGSANGHSATVTRLPTAMAAPDDEELDDTDEIDEIHGSAAASGFADDYGDGYGEVETVAPMDVAEGDLVQIIDGVDHWGVVTCAPGPSLFTDDGDDDEGGEVTIEILCWTEEDGEQIVDAPEDGEVTIRRVLRPN
ncbi:DUF853 family protein [Nocardia sp. IFM 10818]